jgi:DNA-binding IclR family transcriptional regulator
MKTNRSVERAMSVLMYVCQVGLTDISRGAGLDKATTLRLLTTLVNIDLVRQRE